jgi:3-dehydroquinate synthase
MDGIGDDQAVLMTRKVRVALGPRSYEICIGQGILPQLTEALKKFGFDKNLAVITHPRIAQLYGNVLVRQLKQEGWRPRVFTVPAGERFKTLRSTGRLYDHLIREKMERNSPLIALGGGVIGDLVGFVAATYLRGVPYVQVPTTLVSQVDSSVGGKTGVDHPLAKNMIGAFYQPRLVWIDLNLLKTLPPRELRAGLAEVVKYGVIADAAFFDFLEKHYQDLLALRPAPLIRVVSRSCRIKADVVAQDEREGGLRAILNFGHTFGHSIETLTGYRTFRHGEAVAIGMVCAARLSHRLGLCDGSVVSRTEALLQKMGLPTRLPRLSFSSFFQTLQRDKKVLQGTIRVILPTRIGEVRILPLPDKKVLKEVLQLC